MSYRQFQLFLSLVVASACVPSVSAETHNVEVIYPSDNSFCLAPDTQGSLAGELLAMSEIKEEVLPSASSVSEKEFTQVDQQINADAKTPFEMFTFSPDYVEIQPGDTVRFLNSLGQHTVVSIKGMIPEGAEPFSISHQKIADIKFDKPGIYGVRCRVHSRYGMVMMVKVGDELPNLEQARQKRHYRRAATRFKRLFKKLDESL